MPSRLMMMPTAPQFLATQLTLNPTMGEAEAMFWIDQIVDYNSPRMGLALGVLSEGQINSNGVRYIDEVFTDVEVTPGVVYGNNITVIPALQGAPPAAEDLICDIYEPAGDTESDRPLILYFHTGNFLPQYVNGSAVGNRTDSCAVALCTEFAKKGYVVASCDYRLGWNALAGTQDERTLAADSSGLSRCSGQPHCSAFLPQEHCRRAATLMVLPTTRSPCLERVRVVTSPWLQLASPVTTTSSWMMPVSPLPSSGTIQAQETKSQW